MKMLIFTILFCFCITSICQDYKHLCGKSVDITCITYKKDSIFLTIYLDGYKINSAHKEKICNNCVNCKFSLYGDSVAIIRSKFIYLINGKIYKNGKRNNILKSLNSYENISYEVYSKCETFKLFGIKTKHGLIKIDYNAP